MSVIASSLPECLSNMQKVCDYIHSWCFLTKLLYVAPVWLYKRMDIFNDFFARSSLKILGSQFYPSKQLTNVLTGLPPLHLIVRTIIVKFILKSLTQRDSSSARILQIEETPNHEFFPQVYDTKMFLPHIHKVGKPNRYLGGNLGRMRKFLASERKFLG